MGVVAFTKVEGLGNDFILLDRLDQGLDRLTHVVGWAQAIAARLCDRRLGIGADGLLVVGAPRTEDALASMTVVNADGSRPEMCGNGLRCVAAFLANRYKVDALRIDTDAGPRDCRIVGWTASSIDVTIDMGPAIELGKQTPAAGGGREFIGIGVGNPHAICFVSGAEPDLEGLAREYGPGIELDTAYRPERTNVEFARREPDGSLTLWVWERGVGITSACGTGACATAAAAVREGLVPADTPVRVRLPGGVLTIVVPSAEAGVEMTGPSRHVFTGVVNLDEV